MGCWRPRPVLAGLLAVGVQGSAEIAAVLYLTQPTVDHHVSDILSKLGYRSRVQAEAKPPPTTPRNPARARARPGTRHERHIAARASIRQPAGILGVSVCSAREEGESNQFVVPGDRSSPSGHGTISASGTSPARARSSDRSRPAAASSSIRRSSASGGVGEFGWPASEDNTQCSTPTLRT